VAYKRFEDLPVWNAAIDLASRTFALTAAGALDAYAGLRDQIERAAVSVSNNIAEGFERGSYQELLTFLYYALGSAGEVRSMLLLIPRLPGGDRLRASVDELIPITRDVSRQLNGWIEALKNSSNRGPRYQNDASRAAREDRRRAEAYMKNLEQVKRQRYDPPGTNGETQ
jgi:four helix bundle protein